MKKIKYFATILSLGIMFLGFSSDMEAQTKEGKQPVITSYYAVEKATFQSSINFYLAAEDPNSDMVRVAVQVIQTGYGSYPTSWIYLKPEHESRFSGYLQWNTAVFGNLPEWTQVTVGVSVYDRTGLVSNEVVFPVTFVSQAVSIPPLPSPFDKGNAPRLGYINVQLRNPTRDDLENNPLRRRF